MSGAMRVLLISVWIGMWVTRAYIGVNMRGIGFLSVSLQKVRMRPALPLSMSDMGGADGGFNDILEQQFLELSTGKGKKLNWSKFYDWEEVQALLAEEVFERCRSTACAPAALASVSTGLVLLVYHLEIRLCTLCHPHIS